MPFELPEFEERYRMLTYYMSKYLLKAVGGHNAATIVVEGVEEEHIKEAAEATKGFSGEFVLLNPQSKSFPTQGRRRAVGTLLCFFRNICRGKIGGGVLVVEGVEREEHIKEAGGPPKASPVSFFF